MLHIPYRILIATLCLLVLLSSVCLAERPRSFVDAVDHTGYYIYTDTTFVGDIVDAGAPALAYGANWTVEVETAPVAESVAAATGGAVAPTAAG